MARAVFIPLAVMLMAAAPAAWAQSPTPDSENGRFTFKHQTGDELLRLDGRTGQVSLCSKRTAGWACMAVPDERAALEAEIGRLQAENAALKREMIARGVPLPGGVNPPQRSDEVTIRLPTEADLDRVMNFVEKAWRRLLDMVWVMQREAEKKKS